MGMIMSLALNPQSGFQFPVPSDFGITKVGVVPLFDIADTGENADTACYPLSGWRPPPRKITTLRWLVGLKEIKSLAPFTECQSF